MTITNDARTGAGVIWARVEDGFHVGSRDGEFVGYIERRADGRFVAFNLHSREIGAFADLTSAMRATTTHRSASAGPMAADR